MAHQFARARLRALNARAVAEHVNLAVTLAGAGHDAREWVALNALPHLRRDLQIRPTDATAVRARDVRGYGSSARWAHTPDDAPRS